MSPSTSEGSDVYYRRAAQLEKLENKIEHLVNALSNSQAFAGQPSPPPSEQSSRLPADIAHTLCASMPGDDVPAVSPLSNEPSQSAAGHQSRHPSGQLSIALDLCDYQSLGVTVSEAEVLLDRYKRLMAPGMLYVVVSREATAQQLYAEKPLLLHAIVTVAYFHNLGMQQRMVKQWMRDFSERVLMNNEKNIGILQAILVSETLHRL